MKNYGKWALITGASSGIGKAFAEKLAGDGVNCVLVSNEARPLAELSVRLEREFGVTAVACCCDLSNGRYLAEVRKKTEGIEIDILINNASFGILLPFYDVDMDRYRECINLSVESYTTLTYEFLKGMMLRDRGAVIIVSSVNAFSPVGYSPVYTAAKAYELYFGEALWCEAKKAGSNVDILTLCPAATRTNFQSIAATKTAPWAWEAHEVADYAFRRLGRASSAVTTWRGRLYYFVTKVLPRRLSIYFATWAINSNLSKNRKGRTRDLKAIGAQPERGQSVSPQGHPGPSGMSL